VPERVLLIEDDARLAEMVCEYLGAAGFEVSRVGNGTGALERLARQPYDALVLDLTLPDMDGLEVCRRLRAHWDTPVLMLTARGEPMDRVVGLEGVRVDIAMLETADGNGRLELMKFHAPPVRVGDQHAPPNTLGIRRIAFAVDDIDAAVAGLRARGTELVGEVERYEDSYRLCYVRGPEGIIVMLAEQIG